MRIGLVVPHIFMQKTVLPEVIFSPGQLALGLAAGLQAIGHEVTLFTPGKVETNVKNVVADLSYFEAELKGRNDTYIELLKKHPLTFITLSRQVQSELIAKAYSAANNDELDIVHIYTNEEDTALPFSNFCQKPVIFTHHDPFNFLVHYKNLFPKYPQLNWLSISYAQRKSMPADTNWIANIYHGLNENTFRLNAKPEGNYVAYLGRIIESKGVHLAIAAVKLYNKQNPSRQLKLKIAGKHYAGKIKNTYWEERIAPQIDNKEIEYVGYIKTDAAKQDFLGNAQALLIPSVYEEPFGMVMIEALATGTPLVGLDSGAIPEVIEHSKTGYVVQKPTGKREDEVIRGLSDAMENISKINRVNCRREFTERFTLDRMCQEHILAYKAVLQNN
jgi:glycosyltransferase involved in cell wall biosynthesis